jgi:hypothetical protein
MVVYSINFTLVSYAKQLKTALTFPKKVIISQKKVYLVYNRKARVYYTKNGKSILEVME